MALLRGVSRVFPYYTSHANPKVSSTRLIVYRGFASKLFVKGLCFFTTQEKLAETFSQFGQVLEANIIMDKARNTSKGYGYVTFAKEDEAKKALLDMNGKVLDGRVIFVDSARPCRYYTCSTPAASEPSKSRADN